MIQENAHRALKTAQRRKWILITILTAVVVVILGTLILYQVKRISSEKINGEYAKIEAIYNKETLDFQTKLQEAQQNKTTPPLFPDYTQSVPLFDKFLKQYPNDPNGWQAGLRASSYYILKNEPNLAKADLEILAQNTSKYPILQIRVKTALAGLLASEKNYTQAISKLQEIANLPQNPLPGQTLLFLAKVYYLSGKKDDSIKTLDQIISPVVTGDSGVYNFQNPDLRSVQEAKIWLNYIQSGR